MSNFKILDNGTKTATNSNGDNMHCCQYCETWFLPKRRFIQKYCSESCRVLACRHRKKDLFGLSGGNINDRNKTTNTEIVKTMDLLKNSIESDIEMMRDQIFEITMANNGHLKAIKKNQGWHIFLTVTIPLIAPNLSKVINNFFSGKTPIDDYSEFISKVKPIVKDAPDDLKDKVMSAAQLYYQSIKTATEAKDNKKPGE